MSDLKLSGRGMISAGDYATISVNGTATLSGEVSCTAFDAAGAVTGEMLACTGEMQTSGKATFSGKVKAKSVESTGAFSCGALVAVKSVDVAGALSSAGEIKCESLTVRGNLRADGQIDAWQVAADGSVTADELHAETVTLRIDGKAKLGRIKGEQVSVTMSKPRSWCRRIPLLSALAKNTAVTTEIVGEDITLDYVDCPKVTGRNVTIGDGCRIDLVVYRDKVEISGKARVGKVEKSEK